MKRHTVIDPSVTVMDLVKNRGSESWGEAYSSSSSDDEQSCKTCETRKLIGRERCIHGGAVMGNGNSNTDVTEGREGGWTESGCDKALF